MFKGIITWTSRQLSIFIPTAATEFEFRNHQPVWCLKKIKCEVYLYDEHARLCHCHYGHFKGHAKSAT
ncbi:hypothetical protein TNIN_20661 [Trichonephila inaurata madagascariensis]|uniref:Uncharacterized protein n=1 Tax=Trichonephila inaurata madagascariensis TaxID=2747483 RepID=A0A8X6MLC8_9ARAC|nr:hypothetical protein TNIN_20661 [Trichonephila inaurata madagascariensis]